MSKTDTNWMKLDNAAKIYPAARSRKWMALFRLSAQLQDTIDPDLLQKALSRTLSRFPSFSQRLRRGFFWYYLERLNGCPDIEPDVKNPCQTMDFNKTNGFMFRVRYHENQIAVEFFHVLTDGTGGFIFLKTLTAEYVTLRYGASIPRSSEVLDCDASPLPDELEDGYIKYAGTVSRSRREALAYPVPGTLSHFNYITTGIMDAGEVLKIAKSYGATLTEFLVSVLILAIERIQTKHNPNRLTHKPVKICVPINLRKYYNSVTVRNFASYINPGIDPKYGEYTLSETIRAVRGYMAVELDEKLLNAKFSTNVLTEQNVFLRMAPLFLKSPTMRLAFQFKGDRQTSSIISNLGAASLPPEMARFVQRMDFILGPLSRNRVAGACVSYDGKLVMHFTRTIEESEVERLFFTSLVKIGIHVTVESNQG